jgi:hypothetical protein
MKMRSSADSPQPIIEEPGYHGMFLLGSDTVFLCHMPMFTMARHMYQVILRVTLDPDIMSRYQALHAANPGIPYNLANADPFTLTSIKTGQITQYSATLYDGYSGDSPGPVLFGTDTQPFQVTIDAIVHYRHFDFAQPHAEEMMYILYGFGNEAHLSHYIARETDFQHELSLPSVPQWLSSEQLAGGVEVNVVDMPSLPTPCENPLANDSYDVLFQGRPDARVPLQVGANATVWFSTGNLLNAQDPCAPSAGGHGGSHHSSEPRK